ncbi:hypothetical protein DN069_07710 [Streptacidiphilus pinicola]|uniref:Resolvase/invertase-type recombinase catalytic domain-containing protein n=1 Tax=Streptacidiphilus pinicola TaxID=2219663 RepID=A0A2X0IRL9_9ACTN|nr:hypothetical protein [Streptacidiphilus pinicola]RAG86233.1 hypothetical protein DN069_07710 [Streptacidiphilus pinicola]
MSHTTTAEPYSAGTPAGRPLAAVYVCTGELESTALMAVTATEYARDVLGWDTVTDVRDRNRGHLLTERDGWQRLLGLIQERQVTAVITRTRAMVAADETAFEELRRELAALGATLEYVPPRRAVA